MTRKTAFFEGWSWFKFNNLGVALGTNLKFYTSLSKGSKLKVRKFWRANSYVCRSYRGKTGRGAFLHFSIILQNIFYAAEVANLCKKKLENTCTGWCFKFYDWRNITFSFKRLFLPTHWSLSTDNDGSQQILEKANKSILKKSFAYT